MFEPYLDTLAEDDRRALAAVVARVRVVAPEAAEGRSYGMPAFRYRDRPLLGFSASQKHLSLHPFSPAVLDALEGQLDGYGRSKGTLRFTVEHPVTAELVTAMVQLRMDEIDGG
jgi:uncharacterized protein YdhG (YjbR/CyaY superfamily)